MAVLTAALCWPRWRLCCPREPRRRRRCGRRAGPSRRWRVRAPRARGAAGARRRPARASSRSASAASCCCPTTAARSWRQAPVPVSVTLTAVRFADATARLGRRPWRRRAGHRTTAARRWTRQLDGRRIGAAALLDARAGQRRRQATRSKAPSGWSPTARTSRCSTCWSSTRERAARGRRLRPGAGQRRTAARAGHRGVARLDNPKGLHLYAVRQRGDTLAASPASRAWCCVSHDGGPSFKRLATPYKGSFFTARTAGDGEHRARRPARQRLALDDDRRRELDASVAAPVPVSHHRLDQLAPTAALLLANQAGHAARLTRRRAAAAAGTPLPPLTAVLRAERWPARTGVRGVRLHGLARRGLAMLQLDRAKPCNAAALRPALRLARRAGAVQPPLRRRRCCACWSPLLLGWQATQLQLNASFEKTIPDRSTPTSRNFLAHQNELQRPGQRGAHRRRQPAGHRSTTRSTWTRCASSATRSS